ncbi:unnamed protein product [Durusdinium trenchii]|uniref:EF-hand domain-containing protein n=1 Tax=Durusdinium trenchii TaxID=1381693 RepID=A0ABP0JYP5_9DINO
MEGDHFNDLARSLTRTEYQRIGDTKSLAGDAPAWQFTGKPWTQAETLRSREVRHGCGITPRVYPAPVGSINEEFATSREDMQFATMAIAAQAGQPLRKRELDDTDRLRKQPVYWHQHDHVEALDVKLQGFGMMGFDPKRPVDLSASGRKESGAARVSLPLTARPEDELPGGRSFTPANARHDGHEAGGASPVSLTIDEKRLRCAKAEKEMGGSSGDDSWELLKEDDVELLPMRSGAEYQELNGVGAGISLYELHEAVEKHFELQGPGSVAFCAAEELRYTEGESEDHSLDVPQRDSLQAQRKILRGRQVSPTPPERPGARLSARTDEYVRGEAASERKRGDRDGDSCEETPEAPRPSPEVVAQPVLGSAASASLRIVERSEERVRLKRRAAARSWDGASGKRAAQHVDGQTDRDRGQFVTPHEPREAGTLGHHFDQHLRWAGEVHRQQQSARMAARKLYWSQRPKDNNVAYQVVSSSWFVYGISVVILINMILLGFEDFCIITLSVLETATELWARATVNVGDSQVSTSQLRFFRSVRLARALRGVRMVRLLRYVGALRTLVLSIASSMASLLWTLVLLVLICYTFGIMFTQMVSDYCRYELGFSTMQSCTPVVGVYWSSLEESMLTLFMTISGGINWGETFRPLIGVGWFAMVCHIIFITIAVLAVVNVVTGVFCTTAMESAAADKEIATMKQLQKKNAQLQDLRDAFAEIVDSESNTVNIEDFSKAMSSARFRHFLESMSISTTDIDILFTIIDTDQSGLIDLEEFVQGCLQLHGPAKSLQLARMSFENKITRKARSVRPSRQNKLR